MAYPNNPLWSALVHGRSVDTGECRWPLSVIDAGDLKVSSGKLLICDPLMADDQLDFTIDVEPGRYPVRVTIADVSTGDEVDHFREAYVSLLIDQNAKEVSRRIITPLEDSDAAPEIGDDGCFAGFTVDAGLACLVDANAFASSMPDNWFEQVSDESDPASWFSKLDDPTHYRSGVANVSLPDATDGENIVIVHSGWGDGAYPIVGGFDASGRLVRVHIDFTVIWPMEA